MLRHVRWGDREALRGVYVAVRDAGWGTHPHDIHDLREEVAAEGFDLSWTDASGPVVWRGTLRGDADGVVYEAEGVAREAFDTQRTGMCVLHPAREAQGAQIRVEHADGTVTESAFPDLISPHQPFFGIRAIEHEVAPGLWLRTELEGEIFEMEDQRNWTDASFKTYCRPLDLPRPYRIETGETVRHRVRLSLRGAPPAVLPFDPLQRVTLSVGPLLGPVAKVGVLYDGPAGLTEAIPWVDTLGVVLEGKGTDEARLREAAELAQRFGWELDAYVRVADADDLVKMDRKATVARYFVEPSALRAELSEGPLQGRLWSWTGGNFTELNRERPDCEEIDGIGFSTNAQVHAFDDVSIVETLEGLHHALLSARALCRRKPVRVGPSVLGPLGDPRCASPLGAAWMVAAIGQATAARAQAITVGRLSEWRSPAFGAALRMLDKGNRRAFHPTTSSDPLRVQGFVLDDALVLVSFSDREERVNVGMSEYVVRPFGVSLSW